MKVWKEAMLTTKPPTLHEWRYESLPGMKRLNCGHYNRHDYPQALKYWAIAVLSKRGGIGRKRWQNQCSQPWPYQSASGRESGNGWNFQFYLVSFRKYWCLHVILGNWLNWSGCHLNVRNFRNPPDDSNVKTNLGTISLEGNKIGLIGICVCIRNLW